MTEAAAEAASVSPSMKGDAQIDRGASVGCASYSCYLLHEALAKGRER